jgi:pilus biogenesis lipoprotein CpaD
MLKSNAVKLLAAALLASACAPMTTESDSPKQLQVRVTAESYVVKLDKRGHNLRPGEKQELDAYLAHLGDLQSVEFSVRRTHRGMDLKSLAPVEKELVAMGADPKKIFPLAEIGVDYQGEWADVEIIAKRYVAITPGCPDQSRPEDPLGNQNVTSSNFGCATAASLAMSVADPRDLARGRDTGPASGVHSAASVTRYDTDAVKALKNTSTETSATSN